MDLILVYFFSILGMIVAGFVLGLLSAKTFFMITDYLKKKKITPEIIKEAEDNNPNPRTIKEVKENEQRRKYAAEQFDKLKCIEREGQGNFGIARTVNPIQSSSPNERRSNIPFKPSLNLEGIEPSSNKVKRTPVKIELELE